VIVAARLERSLGFRSPRALDLGSYAAALAIAYGVKRFCSTAGADELEFLLRPTAAMVELLTGCAFVAERGAGFFSRELSVVIAPVCAGANFLVVAFTALVLGFSARAQGPRRKGAWFLASAAGAYLATLVVNATRITLSLRLAEPLHANGLSAAAVHRLLGIGVYLGGLLMLYALAGRVFAKRTLSALELGVPLGVYAAVTLVTPWLGGAGATARYWTHASVVGAAVVGAAILAAAWKLAKPDVTRRQPQREPPASPQEAQSGARAAPSACAGPRGGAARGRPNRPSLQCE